MAGTPRPLDGVFVLDLGQIQRGPCAGFLLAMADATAVEVESAGGETLRRRALAAPVRDLEEAVNDLHPHERGMPRRVDRPEVGRVALPSSPPRFEGAPTPDIVPSSRHDGDEAEVLGGMLGMGDAEREAPRAAGATGPRLGAG